MKANDLGGCVMLVAHLRAYIICVCWLLTVVHMMQCIKLQGLPIRMHSCIPYSTLPCMHAYTSCQYARYIHMHGGLTICIYTCGLVHRGTLCLYRYTPTYDCTCIHVYIYVYVPHVHRCAYMHFCMYTNAYTYTTYNMCVHVRYT